MTIHRSAKCKRALPGTEHAQNVHDINSARNLLHSMGDDPPWEWLDLLVKNFAKARVEERERCIKIAEDYGRECDQLADEYAAEIHPASVAEEIAARIRALS